ncbi:hypothetical protein DIJ60_22385, partial [Burkholderia pseudomallei]
MGPRDRDARALRRRPPGRGASSAGYPVAPPAPRPRARRPPHPPNPPTPRARTGPRRRQPHTQS